MDIRLDLLTRPQIFHLGVGKNFPKDKVTEYDSSERTLGHYCKVVGGYFIGIEKHLHYSFYFRLPPDFIKELLCHSNLKATCRQLDNDLDEGILSGTLFDFLGAMMVFCKSTSEKEYRIIFNGIANYFEADGIRLPFQKYDQRDKTYAIKG